MKIQKFAIVAAFLSMLVAGAASADAAPKPAGHALVAKAHAHARHVPKKAHHRAHAAKHHRAHKAAPKHAKPQHK